MLNLQDEYWHSTQLFHKLLNLHHLYGLKLGTPKKEEHGIPWEPGNKFKYTNVQLDMSTHTADFAH